MSNNGQGPQGPKMNWTMAAIAAVGVFVVFNLVSGANQGVDAGEIDYKSFEHSARSGDFKKLEEMPDDRIVGVTPDGKRLSTTIPSQVKPYYDLEKYVDSYDRFKPKPAGLFGSLLMSLLPMALFLGVWIYMMRKMQGGGAGGLGNFAKSKHKEEHPETRFQDVAGIDEAQNDLTRLVDYLRSPQKFGKLGGRIPKGVLMVGPPGTGKTLIAKAVAGEASVPFFSISGSDFVEMFVGVGAARVRDLFGEARKKAPCIIFIDEIDAIGKKRGQGLSSNDEREQTLNQILVEMDGFGTSEGVIVIAATNRIDVLDPALIRPGRFDKKIHVSLPDLAGREKILGVHVRKNNVPLASDLDLRTIAIGTPQFSGADLENLVNEAATFAEERGATMVTFHDFEMAKDKIMMGEERKTLMMTPEERKMTAYHEAGHALVALSEPHSDPIYKATIIPRGGALGYVVRLPEGDRVSLSRARLFADLAVAMGGRVAEEKFFGTDMVTTGASGDFDMATSYATKMVTEWGMSDKLGPRRYTDKDQSLAGQFGSISDDRKKLIDSEIDTILEQAYARAKEIQDANEGKMHLLAEALLKYDTLTGDEIRAVVDGKDLDEIRAAAEAARQSGAVRAPGNDNTPAQRRGNDRKHWKP